MARFAFFGGKGGVGKTTVSAAYALKCATAGLETLVVSTDPAHSTSDVFDQQFSDEPEPVADHDGLHAMEIDPDQEVEDHLGELRRQLGEQLSPAMVNEVSMQLEMAHQTPGAYEAALFDRFIDVMRDADDFDRVVFDTAPTAGTLRLLSLPEFLQRWIEGLLEKREKSIDYFERAALGEERVRRMQEADPIIARLTERKERFEFAGQALREDAAFHLVCNPDQLSIRETRRTIETLEAANLPLKGIVVNRLTPEPEEDEEGRGARYLRDRVATERERLREIRDFEAPVVAEIETRSSEVVGSLLADVADELAIEPTARP